MKNLHLVALASAAVLLASAFPACADEWSENYDSAAKKAQQEKKLMLLDFTGSDWCGWCIKLDKEVFSKSEFKKYAKDNLVLVKLDFPRGKSQTAAVKKQNEELAAKFNIQGYPTVIVLDSNGQQVGQLGYMEGGPKAFIAELDKLKK
jgi:protein disulfide-isomerase